MRLQAAKVTRIFHKAPDEPFIPEGIPVPGPRPNRSDHPPVREPDRPPLPPAKEPPAPVRRNDLQRRLKAIGKAPVDAPYCAYLSAPQFLRLPLPVRNDLIHSRDG